jgi:hypothetical protein
LPKLTFLAEITLVGTGTGLALPRILSAIFDDLTLVARPLFTIPPIEM